MKILPYCKAHRPKNKKYLEWLVDWLKSCGMRIVDSRVLLSCSHFLTQINSRKSKIPAVFLASFENILTDVTVKRKMFHFRVFLFSN